MTSRLLVYMCLLLCALFACKKESEKAPVTHLGNGNPVTPVPPLVSVPAPTVVATPFTLSCTVSSRMDSMYQDDAAMLALNYLHSIRHADTACIIIEPSLKATLLRALAAVHSSTSLQRDSVTDRQEVHAVCSRYQLRQIFLGCSTSQSWFAKLCAGNMVTGNAQVDTLLSEYHFTFERANSAGDGAVINAGAPINFQPLLSIFWQVPGVRYAEANTMCLDGTSIKLENWTSSSLDLVYSYGWDDCMSGCIGRRFWRFRVYLDCSVDFVESWGSPNAP